MYILVGIYTWEVLKTNYGSTGGMAHRVCTKLQESWLWCRKCSIPLIIVFSMTFPFSHCWSKWSKSPPLPEKQSVNTHPWYLVMIAKHPWADHDRTDGLTNLLLEESSRLTCKAISDSYIVSKLKWIGSERGQIVIQLIELMLKGIVDKFFKVEG